MAAKAKAAASPAPAAAKEPEEAIEALPAVPATVVVACKLPHGLNVNGHKVSGNSIDLSVHYSGRQPLPFGFALTPNFPGDVWAKWLAANAQSAMVKNGLIFAEPTETAARAKAKSLAHVRSGMEQGR